MTAVEYCAKITGFRKLKMSNTNTMLPKAERRSERKAKDTNVSASPASPVHPKLFWLVCAAASLAVLGAYANHFHNSFHFDDAHTIENNVYIRDLHNIPKFFTDAATFSTLPANQTWRPLVSLSLAIDYHLAGGLNPLWFHISTFFWFLVQLVLMFVLYRDVLDRGEPRAANRYIALFAVLWYGLHPVIAETVNYIIQRADLYATLGVVAGLVVYIRFPHLRKYGVYLVPVVLGALSKAPAVVFCGILFVYIFLFEENADWNRFWTAFRNAIPAVLVCAVLAVLDIKLTSPKYVPATMPHSMYWVTQPYVLLGYFRSFFLPLWLSADTDLNPFPGLSDPLALTGVAFCIALLIAAFWAIKKREHRPIAFGIFWFFIASAPTSLFVLSEVENDHRMFFPFVGLMISVVWAAALIIFRFIEKHPERRPRAVRFVQVFTICLLAAFAFGTWKRNQVWRSEETLWADVTVKSPLNGRGLMNYGLTLMGKGDTPGALAYFQRAAAYTPNYPILEINTGIADGILNRNQEAEGHFRRAISLAPEDAQPYFYYGRWLNAQARFPEAIQNEKSAIEKNPAWMDPRSLLMQIYFEQGQGPALKQLAQDTLNVFPGDPATRVYLARSENLKDPITAAEQLAAAQPTPDRYLNLSLLYHQAARYQDSIVAAKKALSLKPDYPEAYNNIAADYEDLHQWDAAIQAAQQALRLKPDFQLAKNNLAWSLSQKKLQVR
jgi:protein O-mannosyl-transferase